MERFYCKTKIISGAGGVKALGELNIQRLLVVTDPYFMENGTAQRIGEAAGAAQTEYFSQVQPDPSVELAARGAKLVQSFRPDTVVALGGGSAMDCAKAMVYFGGQNIRLVAIPTTSGSGSEVTDFAILTHEQVKHPLVDGRICPDVAILDSDLLQKLPPKLVADTGFDVIAHALEAYVAQNAGGISDALARDAFCTVYGALSASYNGNTAVRQRIHNAATMAGMAFSNAGLGLCHAMSHALGGAFHLPHGRLNAMLLPGVITCNAYAAMSRYAGLARSAGIGGQADSVAVRNLKNALIRLRQQLGMPATLAQAGIDPARVRQQSQHLVAAVLADPCCQTNPIGVEAFMVRSILDEVTGHV